MRRGSLFWGILLVLIGGVLLAQNMGLIPPGVNIWAIFWALVLVFAGLSMLLRAVGPRSTLHVEAYRVPVEGARSAALRLHHGAGELCIEALAGSETGDLLNGTFAGGVNPSVSRGGDNVTVDLRVPGENFTPMMGFEGKESGFNWTVGINPNLPISLDLEVGASRNMLNLHDLQVKELRLQTGASATDITFPAGAGETRASLHSGMASVEVRIPEGVAARIQARGGLASVTVDTTRFPQVSDNSGGFAVSREYCSPDYAAAANRLDLDIESGVGSVQVR